MIPTKHDQSYSSTMSWPAGGQAVKQQIPPIDLVMSEASLAT